MARARRKQLNPINAPALVRWIAVTGFLAVTGLIYVYLSVQLYRLGDHKKALENESTTLRAQNEIASAQIEELTSRFALQRRLKEGFINMIPIANANKVHLNPVANGRNGDAVQPVVNQRGGR